MKSRGCQIIVKGVKHEVFTQTVDKVASVVDHTVGARTYIGAL